LLIIIPDGLNWLEIIANYENKILKNKVYIDSFSPPLVFNKTSERRPLKIIPIPPKLVASQLRGKS